MRNLACAAALMAGVCCVPPAGGAIAGSIVFQDDFGADKLGYNGHLENWNVINGSIDVIGATGGKSISNFFPNAGNEVNVDLDGTTGMAGAIETKQAFDLVLGETYSLSFSYARTGTTSETILFGVGGFGDSLVIESGPRPEAFSHHAVEFVALDSLATIYFGTAGGDNIGPAIDDILLSLITPAITPNAAAGPSPVPVPAALPLLLSAIGGMAFASRRRRGA